MPDTGLQLPPASPASAYGRHSRFSASPSWVPGRSRRAMNSCSRWTTDLLVAPFTCSQRWSEPRSALRRNLESRSWKTRERAATQKVATWPFHPTCPSQIYSLVINVFTERKKKKWISTRVLALSPFCDPVHPTRIGRNTCQVIDGSSAMNELNELRQVSCHLWASVSALRTVNR